MRLSDSVNTILPVCVCVCVRAVEGAAVSESCLPVRLPTLSSAYARTHTRKCTHGPRTFET